jgi:hypothetical protein
MVRVQENRIDAYAALLADLLGSEARPDPRQAPAGSNLEEAAAFWLTLDAINFGSGWFPTLKKRTAKTGYGTIAAGIERRFAEAGRWSAPQLTAITSAELASWLDEDPEHELIKLMAESLRDLGAHVQRLYGRSFAAVLERCGGSALQLVETLASWPCFADVSEYEGRSIPFLKRAQIAAADLHRARAVEFDDLGRLTMFADNLVPHVLRLDRILWFEPELVARIDRGELIEHGSPEEVEIRACAVHAVELLVAASSSGVSAAQIDRILWTRGQAPEYKALPRHRSRSTAY